jgi:glucose/arabinose dehydrogenase
MMKTAALSVLVCGLLISSSSAATLPAGFVEIQVAGGLASPTAMQFAPDGRLFVAEQAGRLRVIKDGVLLPTPFVSVTVSSAGERGLLGIAFDPAFSSNHFLYLYYTATAPTVHNRISRFTANGDVAVAGSEVVIFDLDNLSAATNHNGGALAFGPDGKLYAAVGENANGANAQTLTNLLGKILRINADGTIPADNPFSTAATGRNRAIWAMGLRNPFTFAFNPGGGPLMFLNDVGESTWEEIDDGIGGANYGWPTTEGPTTDPRFVAPRYAYDHSQGACAISGGAFYSPLTVQFPADYVNDYFFADFCGGWIRKLDPVEGNAVVTFATGIASPVDLKVGEDGSLYYLARGAGAATGVVYRIDHQAAAPAITTHPTSQEVPAGSAVTFSVRASGGAPLHYQWQRNGADITGATSQDYTISPVSPADNGARFRAMVSNAAGTATSNDALLTVTTAATGNGLLATYYDNIDFSGATVTRVDPIVDFDWGAGSPAASIGPDTFSVRWAGQVQAQFSERYVFYTQSDDGVRLWVNGQQLVNNWTDHAATEDLGAISLTAGQRYDIRMEFYENGGDALARLLWSSASTPKTPVPAARLYSQPAGASTPFRGVAVAIPGIVQAEEFDEGGEGAGYHDQTAGNEGGQFRTTDVDIEATSDTGGGFNVGWMPADEWLAYTVNVATAGQYMLDARVAANGPGGTFHIDVGGFDVSGPITIPDTGGWQNWTTVSKTLSLGAGVQKLRLMLDANGPTGVFGNVNYFQFNSASAAPASDVVIYASDIARDALRGSWSLVPAAGSPADSKLTTPDHGDANTANALASPADYFEATFSAPANTAYTLWLRIRAQGDSKFNDAVWVQFSDARSDGQPIYPIGTTSGLLVNLATDATAASLDGWGWVNGAYWLNQPVRITFATSGAHTIRIQVREDGVEIDQVVLSPDTYRTSPPGPVSNDATIVMKPSP